MRVIIWVSIDDIMMTLLLLIFAPTYEAIGNSAWTLTSNHDNSRTGSNDSIVKSEMSSCDQVWSSYTRDHSTCCKDLSGNGVKCFPSFIIAGVQKGGTTALSALLCTVDGISFSKKKEIHFFDSLKRYNRGTMEYLKHFQEWNKTAVNGLNPPVFGESTPFYVASRDACQRIAETFPAMKIIVLLREPISRAYSEYQMKKRRVDAQNEFIELAAKHSHRLRHCLKAPLKGWTVITDCLPSEVTTHSHFNRLILNLKAKERLGIHKKWGAGSPASRGPSNLSTRKLSDHGTLNRQSRLSERSRNSSVEYSREHERTAASGAVKPRKLKKKKVVKPAQSKHTICDLAYFCPKKGPHAIALASDGKCGQNPPSRHLNSSICTISLATHLANQRRSGLLWVKILLGRHAAERLPSLGESFGLELRDWEQCAGSLVGPGMTLESLDLAVEKCLEKRKGIKMGIGSQYFYRSLYAVQLYNCFKHIPRRQFLILSSEQLQTQPDDTLKEVLHFIGLPVPTGSLIFGLQKSGDRMAERDVGREQSSDLKDGPRHSQNERQLFIGAAVEKHFPSFESASGWRLSSEYDELPPGLRTELQQFYRPYNALLSQVLRSQYFEDEWTGSASSRNHTVR